MGYATLRVPQPELERIAKTSVELVAVAKELLALATIADAKDASVAQGLRLGASKILDQADTIANAVTASSYLNS